MSSEKHQLLRKLTERIRGSEHLELEFKKAVGGIPNSVWETISAFANTNGGWIVFGVDETNAEVVGVPAPKKMLQDLHNQLRNEQKISHPVCAAGDIEIERAEGAKILVMRVPAASRKDRPVYINDNPYGGTFVRRNEGDFQCNKQEVDRMMREASNESADSTILPELGSEDLDSGSISRYRQRFQNHRPGSAWNGYDDERFLEAIRAVRSDRRQGTTGVTVAGLLMLGKDTDIAAWRSRHLIDYRVVDKDQESDTRWKDRLTWEGNLLGAFENIHPRLTSDLPVKFRLESDQATRIDESPVQIVLREALINLLAHTDYSETQASVIKRGEEGFTFRNPGSSLVPKEDLLSGDRSDPRNPIIVRMFRLIGLAEEAGTGMSQIFHLWRSQGLQMPRVDPGTERYEFVLELRYSHLLSEDDRRWLANLDRDKWSENEQLALVAARHEGRVDNEKVRELTGEHSADVTNLLGRLKDEGYLKKKGRAKGTYYVLGPMTGIIESQAELPLDDRIDSDQDQNSSESTEDSEVSSAENTADNESQLERLAAPARENPRLRREKLRNTILLLCANKPLSIRRLADLLDRNANYLRGILRDLIREKKLEYIYPDTPRHPNQKYRTSSSRHAE